MRKELLRIGYGYVLLGVVMLAASPARIMDAHASVSEPNKVGNADI